MKIKINKLKCNKCEYEWIPRIDVVTVCPKCHSYKWNEEKKSEKPNKKKSEK